MKFVITAWPIDKELQEKIGIYRNSNVKSVSVGRVITQLVEAGYTEVSSYAGNEQDDVTKENTTSVHVHCRNINHYK